jgi:hypothetical protein
MSISVSKWLQLVSWVAPAVLGMTPLAPIAPFVIAGVQAAESLPGAQGKDKLDAAVQIARIGIAATNAQAGHVVVDPQLADAAIQSGISTVVNVVNLTHRGAQPDATGQP